MLPWKNGLLCFQEYKKGFASNFHTHFPCSKCAKIKCKRCHYLFPLNKRLECTQAVEFMLDFRVVLLAKSPLFLRALSSQSRAYTMYRACCIMPKGHLMQYPVLTVASQMAMGSLQYFSVHFPPSRAGLNQPP